MLNQATINGNLTLDFAGFEAVNTICSNISFSGRSMKRIVVTSCEANDGKSFVTLQIALCMARRAVNVLLVDADLRMSELNRSYDIRLPENSFGLAHYLNGNCGIEDILYETNYPHLYLLPIGREVKTPLSLLTTQDFSLLIDSVGYSFDLVLVDTPPVGVVIDAAEIAGKCDGGILVMEYNKTHKRALRDAITQMQRTGTPLIGCILNKVTMSRIFGKKSNYYYNYGHEYSRSAQPAKRGILSLFKKGGGKPRKRKS